MCMGYIIKGIALIGMGAYSDISKGTTEHVNAQRGFFYAPAGPESGTPL
jgi:hypothetical protein